LWDSAECKKQKMKPNLSFQKESLRVIVHFRVDRQYEGFRAIVQLSPHHCARINISERDRSWNEASIRSEQAKWFLISDFTHCITLLHPVIWSVSLTFRFLPNLGNSASLKDLRFL
jgi:hypothetical protein